MACGVANIRRETGVLPFHIRVADRRFAFGAEEKEKFRTLMRLQEKFAGCWVVSYYLMCKYF
jgi:hypothetical protein